MTNVTREPRTRSFYTGYTLALLCGIAFTNAMDASILAAVIPSIQKEFHLSDAQIGVLSAVFVLSTAIAVLPLGYWADRAARRTVIALGVGFWSLATLLTGVTRSYPQILGARSLVGIGEASLIPAGTSLVGDHFPKRARGRAMSAILACAAFGAGVGVIGGGVVAMQLGWRVAFYGAAVPGLVLAVLAFTIREPLRGSAEPAGPKAQASHQVDLRAIRSLLRIRTFTAATAATTFQYFALSGVAQFVPLYLHRQLGVDLAHAGALTGTPMLVGNIVGSPLGGWLVDRMSKRSGRATMQIVSIGCLIAAAASVLAFSSRSSGLFEAGFMIAALAAGAITPALSIVNQNVVVPSLRASASSVTLFSRTVLGVAVGSLAVGAVSDLTHDLRVAMLILMPASLVVAAVSAAAARGSTQRDIEQMEESWARSDSDRRDPAYDRVTPNASSRLTTLTPPAAGGQS